MTFDGRKYTFQATCQYILAKSRTSGEFTISLQNIPCGQVRLRTFLLCLYPEDMSDKQRVKILELSSLEKRRLRGNRIVYHSLEETQIEEL